jgi:hypothetical protein
MGQSVLERYARRREMKRVEINDQIPHEFRIARIPREPETLEVIVGGETYRIIDQRLGIAVNVKTGEHVTLEIEEVSLMLAS